jgi:hypothetical protein
MPLALSTPRRTANGTSHDPELRDTQAGGATCVEAVRPPTDAISLNHREGPHQFSHAHRRGVFVPERSTSYGSVRANAGLPAIGATSTQPPGSWL